ncbi:hypothetical protein NOV72_01380 [Caballeronia novacaledonica]|uniref:Periplasmic protein n=1 Tax=Caballeronia novacaledonica TaxID=1544861 RepID=A0A2U3I230_9BURK|nr:hypothetical protein NOV72_01380 [Caballeronia novacaledonica]
MAAEIVESGSSDSVRFTPPIFSPQDGVLFSAFCLHRGYVAFTLSFDAACRGFGTCSQQRDELLLAFELNQSRIAEIAEGKLRRADGSRIVLHASDFN